MLILTLRALTNLNFSIIHKNKDYGHKTENMDNRPSFQTLKPTQK